MRILVAPDKFKGSLTASEAADAIAGGIREVDPAVTIDLCPVADGGEGTVRALVQATGGQLRSTRVTGPLPEMKVDAEFGLLGDGATAVVEMAAASGLALLRPEDRSPLATTTFGTGELMMAAIGLGVSKIILGIGGSATVDGGIGAAQACRLPTLLADGEPVSPSEPLTGADLPRVLMIKHGRGSPVERIAIVVACDVDNPLCGPRGAAVVYGPQKGATPGQVRWLDEALLGLAERTGKLAEANTPGAGAAGGLGFAMIAYFGASLQSGATLVLEACGFARRLQEADLCITGEGRLDESSLHGKAPMAVARLCRERGVPCIALAGSLGTGLDQLAAHGVTHHASLCDGGVSREQAMTQAASLLQRCGAANFRKWREGLA